MGFTSENKPEKQITMGILAHVDAGKTTLSEGILYTCKAIRKLRITMKNTFREFLIVIAAVARVACMHGLWLVTRVKHEKRVANRQPSFHLLQFYKAMMISS